MTPRSGIIRYQHNEIHCLSMGTGKKLLLAFHGFGSDALLFQPLSVLLEEEYTLVSVNLPGHGITRWRDKYMAPKDLMAIIQGIKNDFGATQISLIGFSLGGRVCLTIIEQQPDWIEQVVLLAPDGLKKNFWYQAATRNVLGRILFQHFLADPERWIHRFSGLQKLGLLPEAHIRLARTHLKDEQVRKQVALVWPVMSRLMPHMGKVQWNINKHKIKTDLFMGRSDKLFPPETGKSFLRNLKENARLHILDCGHQLLHPGALKEIAAVL